VTSLDNLGPQIWDASTFSIVVTDTAAEPKRRKIIYANPAFTELTGFAAADVVGKSAALMEGPRTDPNKSADCEGDAQEQQDLRRDVLPLSQRRVRVSVARDRGIADRARWQREVPHVDRGEGLVHRAVRAQEGASVAGTFVPLTLPMPLREYPSNTMPKHLTRHHALSGSGADTPTAVRAHQHRRRQVVQRGEQIVAAVR
jgi:hypothetical protein